MKQVFPSLAGTSKEALCTVVVLRFLNMHYLQLSSLTTSGVVVDTVKQMPIKYQRTKIGIKTCIGIESRTGTGPGSGTRIDIKNGTVNPIKIDRKIGSMK
ncbi:hypothetical protein EVAR_33115_1 [Eumeta japonica]|uniref:Uncharacterized protein n=1 Tax=Eumeta variegata TaxID=151549 RepID=A0A4C1YA00_EUMVA|nr:hypothetical protein EVAR_33115_1 [Eumeta japonica]